MSLEEYFNAVFVSSGQYFSADNFSDSRPAEAEDYSNLGSALIGYLVERIAQSPFDVYCKNNIFTPLGMSKTEWRLANTPLSELAIPYSEEITSANPHYTFPDYPNGEKGVTTEMFYDTDSNIGVIVFSNEEDAELEDVVSLLFNYGDTQ